MAKEIPLTQGKVALVDDEDYEWLMGWKWMFHSGGYAVRTENYGRDEAGKRIRKSIRMHRILMSTPEHLDVDHKDGDGLNNKKENLRNCTTRQNTCSRRKSKNKTSVFKGVYRHSLGKGWVARIVSEGRDRYLGYYNNERDAAASYNEQAVKTFGEYAILNDLEKKDE